MEAWDVAVYKQEHRRGQTVIVLGQYGYVPKTQEPRYLVGLLELSRVQRSTIGNIKDSIASLFSVMHLSNIPEFRHFSRTFIKGFFEDWAYQRVYEQESTTDKYTLWTGGRDYYTYLSGKYQLFPLENENTDKGGKLILDLCHVSQHVLHHPLERTKLYKTDKKSLADNRN